MTQEPTIPDRYTDLETPDQSIDGAERKMTESTSMPNVKEQEKKTIEFSPKDNVDETTNNTPETLNDDSQTKRTSSTEKARATEEKLQQMADKVETTDRKREKHIKKDLEEMKKSYDTVSEKL